MMFQVYQKPGWFVLGMLVVVLVNSSASQQTSFCRQGIFKPSKEPLHVNVTKQVFVNSVLECAQLCRAGKSCEAFKHRNVRHDDINCQVTQGKPELSTLTENNDAKEKWTLYILKTVESPKCIKNNLCHEAGRCLADSCEPEGFKCECDEKYYGKYCQYERYYDYDITFPNATEINFIDLGTIDEDFNEFTFSVWINFNPGFIKYPLVSYISENSTEIFALAFDSDDDSGETIAKFSGNLFGRHVVSIAIPINDGYWHHVGFSWSGVTGRWILLIDGVLWASRTVFTGRTIPSGAILNIGKVIDNGVSYNLVGNISRVNLWSKAKNGNEIESIAKSPGSRDGDLITWFMVKDYISDLRIIRPSDASFSGEGMNYDITLPLSSPVKYPGPSKAMRFLSSCLWFFDKGTGMTPFFAYYTWNTFLFRYSSGTTLNSTINGHSTSRNVTNGYKAWHFLCIKWNGEKGTLGYFYDGYQVGNYTKHEKLQTELPAGRNFILGLSNDNAILTQLNIWDYEVATASFIPMSAGGFNIHGNVFSWSNVAKYVPGNITWNTDVYLPGFAVLEKRTKWCNDVLYSGVACPGELLARLGGNIQRKSMQWRCYCPLSLLTPKYTYDFGTKSPSYHTKHNSLIAIN